MSRITIQNFRLPGERIEESHVGCEERKLQELNCSFLSFHILSL